MENKRLVGALLPVFSLPGDYGIGDFGSSAYEFIDKLEVSWSKTWQILPLNPAGYGNSPYHRFHLWLVMKSILIFTPYTTRVNKQIA